MKKTVALALCLVALLAFGASSAQAAGPLNFYIRGGIMISGIPDFTQYWGLVGANLDLNFGRLSISPECDMTISKFFTFSMVELLPGVILNINLANFYIGAGIILPVVIVSGADDLHGALYLKANAGIKLGGFKLQVFAAGPNYAPFSDSLLGATFGAGF
jgi:hypothetical protein